jgi:hypothetical protein
MFHGVSNAKVSCGLLIYNVKIKSNRRLEVVCQGMLAPRKFVRKKREEVFKDAADEAKQKNWRKMMSEIEESGSAVSILKTQRNTKEPLPRDAVLGTLVRFKQLKRWNLVSEVYPLAACLLVKSESFLVARQLPATLQSTSHMLRNI